MEQYLSFLFWRFLMFPTYFQKPALRWAWGAGDDFWMMAAKRFLLLLPVSALIFACWVSIACMLTVIVREKRRQYVSTLFVTWWDLCRCIFMYWGGFVVFFYKLQDG